MKQGRQVLLFVTFLFLIGSLFFLINKKNLSETKSDNQLIIRDNEHYLSFVPDAEYTIVEYFDYDCIFCQRLHLEAKKEFIDYSKVNYILRAFPSTDIDISPYKALVGECIYLQTGDAGFVKFLLSYYETWGNQKEIGWVLSLAKDIAPDSSALDDCLKNNNYLKQKITSNYVMDNINGIGSTPTFIVYKNGELEAKYNSLNLKLYLSLIDYYSNRSGG